MHTELGATLDGQGRLLQRNGIWTEEPNKPRWWTAVQIEGTGSVNTIRQEKDWCFRGKKYFSPYVLRVLWVREKVGWNGSGEVGKSEIM